MSRSSRAIPDADLDLSSISHFCNGDEMAITSHLARRPTRDDHNHTAVANEVSSRGLERERSHCLPDNDLPTLADIGAFRALELDDLARHRYHGDLMAAQKSIGNLSRAGLVRSRTTYPERSIYLTLTSQGHRLVAERLEREDVNQKIYHGFVKIRDARHDAALYRLYHQELGRIERMGGRVRRVILDFELRHSINRRLAKLNSLPWEEQMKQKEQIAQEHGLRVVNGRIPLPDLRLEYEGPDQQLAKVDLELVTEHYQRGSLALKAKAGFAIYAFAEDAARLRPAMQDPEIMLDILSL
jgi:DNA-binding MarR family transcriptional regulator